LICGVLIFVVKPKYVPIPFFVGSLYTTLGQEIIIGGANFYVLRILAILCIIRIVIKREYRFLGKLNAIDKLFFASGIISVIAGYLQEHTFHEVIARIGSGIDTAGIYFVMRTYIRNLDEVKFYIKVILFLFIPVMLLMVIEKKTGHNLFSIFGGVPDLSQIREGKIRAQGPFAHPILAGTAAASMVPLFIGLMAETGFAKKTYGILGVFSMMVIIICSASSGPIMTFGCSLAGMFFWRFRYKMRTVRWMVVIFLILLELFMKSHFWYLLARIDLVGGSGGWHRAELITSALNHLNEWWLYGTNYTRHWMPTGVSWSKRHTDITNQYIAQGVKGGLPMMIIFITILVYCFKYMGRLIRHYAERPFLDRFMIWSLGSVMFAHMITFFSVSYFDQIIVFLYSIIGMISRLWITTKQEESLMTEYSQ
jgi:hypothetical protein